MKSRLIALLVLISSFGFSQKDIFLHINPTFNSVNFNLNTNYTGLDGKVINLDHFNYYISDVVLTHDGGIQTAVVDPVFLFTPLDFGFYLGSYNIQQIEQLNFLVGVSSRYNTQSGSEAVDISTYPATNPLSFQTPSMYWGWQFGYMHMIVGGNADSNNDQILDAYFEIHNLGDHNQRAVQMPVVPTNTTATQADIYLQCNIEQWLRNMPLATVGVLHDQIGLNDSIMANVNLFPVFTQPLNAGQMENSAPEVLVYENVVSWKNLEASNLKIIDMSGRIISNDKLLESSGNLSLGLNTGLYWIQIYLDNGTPILSKKCLIVNP